MDLSPARPALAKWPTGISLSDAETSILFQDFPNPTVFLR